MNNLNHLNEAGEAHMVDITSKDVTSRSAVARGEVVISKEVLKLLHCAGLPKGDALATARIAGISASKRTSDLIPLCHPVAIHAVEIELNILDSAVEILAKVKTADRTGIEMEALTAVSVSALTLIDMVKGLDKLAFISEVKLLEKHGGRSGDWIRPL